MPAARTAANGQPAETTPSPCWSTPSSPSRPTATAPHGPQEGRHFSDAPGTPKKSHTRSRSFRQTFQRPPQLPEVKGSGLRGDGGEEVDQSAVGVAQDYRAVAPRHVGRLEHDLGDGLGNEAFDSLPGRVDVVDAQLYEHGAV